ncbi:DUF6053 domain-containing protein [Lysobacter yananisis]|uniref:DUF6053 domain-containing protein n=1 Tax=Lysobacter yananisis TaxID=1003114 RepID=UPI003CE50A54
MVRDTSGFAALGAGAGVAGVCVGVVAEGDGVELRCWPAVVGGPSGPMLFSEVAAIGNKSIGPEGPPTTAACVVGELARSRLASLLQVAQVGPKPL